jgi:hypothetical protein
MGRSGRLTPIDEASNWFHPDPVKLGFRDINGLLIDLDGVLQVDRQPLAGTVEKLLR